MKKEDFIFAFVLILAIVTPIVGVIYTVVAEVELVEVESHIELPKAISPATQQTEHERELTRCIIKTVNYYNEELAENRLKIRMPAYLHDYTKDEQKMVLGIVKRHFKKAGWDVKCHDEYELTFEPASIVFEYGIPDEALSQ